MTDGNTAQVRAIADAVAEATIAKFELEHPRPKEADVPAPLKWAAAIVAALFTAGTATLAFWLVSTVSQMQVTLARMDERMTTGSVKDSRFDDIDRRVGRLEAINGGADK